jgi:hypothetical protein
MNMKSIVIHFNLSVMFSLLVFSCQQAKKEVVSMAPKKQTFTFTKPIVLNTEEKAIVIASEVDINYAKLLKEITDSEICPLFKGDELGILDRIDSTGICAEISYDSRLEMIREITMQLKDSSYSVATFYDDNSFLYAAIVHTSNSLDLINNRGTHAWNYNMSSQNIVDTLKAWKSRYDFEVIGVARDFIEISFAEAPEHTTAFKVMVEEFCPDAADWLNDYEYVILMEEGSAYLNLWWD